MSASQSPGASIVTAGDEQKRLFTIASVSNPSQASPPVAAAGVRLLRHRPISIVTESMVKGAEEMMRKMEEYENRKDREDRDNAP